MRCGVAKAVHPSEQRKLRLLQLDALWLYDSIQSRS